MTGGAVEELDEEVDEVDEEDDELEDEVEEEDDGGVGQVIVPDSEKSVKLLVVRA